MSTLRVIRSISVQNNSFIQKINFLCYDFNTTPNHTFYQQTEYLKLGSNIVGHRWSKKHRLDRYR